MTTQASSTVVVRLIAFVFALVILPTAFADSYQPIGTTGYTLKTPSGFTVSDPPNAPKIHYQADAPAGTITIQVIEEGTTPSDALIRNYESGMRTILGNLHQVADVRVPVAGVQSTARQYNSLTEGMSVDIVAVFYAGPGQSLIIHSISQGENVEQIFPYLTSLSAPSRPGATAGTGSIGRIAAPAKPQAVLSTLSPHAAPTVPHAELPPEGYKTLVVDDAAVEFAIPANFSKQVQKPGESHWWDPSANSRKIKLIIQSLDRAAGNSFESVVEGLLAQVNGSAAATLDKSEARPGTYLPVQWVAFDLDRGGQVTHFEYAVVDAPGANVVTVSFVAPKDLTARVDRHFDTLTRTLKPVPRR